MPYKQTAEFILTFSLYALNAVLLSAMTMFSAFLMGLLMYH